MNDLATRGEIVRLEIERLAAEALACQDPDRIEALRREVQIRIESFKDIRREQLIEQLEGGAPDVDR